MDGKTSRRSGKTHATPLKLISAFAAGADWYLGQRATAQKSNETTAIPELLATLTLEGCIVTTDEMGIQPGIARAIRDRGADYVLSVKDNQPTLADSIQDFFKAFQANLDPTPHKFDELAEKDHGRLEVRRCSAFDQLEYLHAQDRWPDLRSSAVIASERTVKDKASLEDRFYISSLSANATRLARAVRQHWRVENGLHKCMNVIFDDNQIHAHNGNAAHNFAVMRHSP